jgi:hypothetical protein
MATPKKKTIAKKKKPAAPKKKPAAPKKKPAASKKKPAASKKKPAAPKTKYVSDQRKKRLRIYETNFKKPVKALRGEDLGDFAIDVLAFRKKVGDASGFVLITNGMSDYRPPRPKKDEAYPQIELLWYTRDVTEEKLRFLYWLATQPFLTGVPIEFGEFVVSKDPIVAGCPNKVVTFLRPITMSEKLMHTGLTLMTGYYDSFVIHLLSDTEYRHMKKSDAGFNRFLDLLDEKKYPLFFDPARPSYL